LGKFNQVCEAFEVLSNPTLKEIYDKNGLKGLKQGIPNPECPGKTVGSYCFTGDSLEIFQRFFGAQDPFGHIVDKEKLVDEVEDLRPLKKEVPMSVQKRPEDIEVNLSC
jgi:DnaJ-class molecular chaperone